MNFIFDYFSKHPKFIVGIILIVISIMFVLYVFKKSVFYGIITIFVFVLIVILYWLYQKYKTLSIKYNNLKTQTQAQTQTRAQMNPEKISINIKVSGDAYFSSKTEYAQGSNQNLNNTKEENKNGNN